MPRFNLTPQMVNEKERILNSCSPTGAKRMAVHRFVDLFKKEIDSRDDRIKDLLAEIESRDELLSQEVQRNMDLELKRILASEGME